MPSCLHFKRSGTVYFTDLISSNSCADMLLVSDFDSQLFTTNCIKENGTCHSSSK